MQIQRKRNKDRCITEEIQISDNDENNKSDNDNVEEYTEWEIY